MEAVVERVIILPNPDEKREQCVKECVGCNVMFSSMEMKGDDVIGDVCIAYKSPKAKWRNYRIEKGTKKVKGKDVEVLYHYSPCNFATHIKHSPKIVEIKKGMGWKKGRYGNR